MPSFSFLTDHLHILMYDSAEVKKYQMNIFGIFNFESP